MPYSQYLDLLPDYGYYSSLTSKKTGSQRLREFPTNVLGVEVRNLGPYGSKALSKTPRHLPMQGGITTLRLILSKEISASTIPTSSVNVHKPFVIDSFLVI